MSVRKFLLAVSSVILIFISSAASRSSHQPKSSYDIIIAGGGTGGISAAIQAARMGASVLVVEPSTWIGGQATAAGVSTMDDMSRQMSGIYEEFINRIKSYYDSRGKSMGTCYWYTGSLAFEPRIGQEAFISMINEARRRGSLEFLMNSEIVSVNMTKRAVSGVTARTPSGNRSYGCKVLIDATEYGDILPLTKTPYRAGNSISKFINPDAMIQDITWTAVIKKYPGGVPGYLKPESPLPGYDLARRNYESFLSADGYNFRNTYPVQTPVNFATYTAYRGIPDSSNPYGYDASAENRQYITKTGLNWGNDYPGTYGWINGRRGLPVSYLEDRNLRLQVEREALIKTLHLIYYIQNELGEPWSVPDDEYTNRILPEAARTLPREWQEIARRMPVIPYVRESRRIIGSHTLTSEELLRNSLSYRDGHTSREFSDAIAIGGYILDLHGANTDADTEYELDETMKSQEINRPRGPFQVPMNILIPNETDGLIAAEKNLSMSRFSAGTLRLQPITMMTGQAAGALAAVCVRDGKQPRQVHPMRVQWELLNSGVSLSLCKYSDVPPEHSINRTVQISNMYGLIAPNEYPHAPSFNLREWDNPVLEMAIIKGADKGVFGVNDIITGNDAVEILTRAQKAVNIKAAGKIAVNKAGNFISRSDFVKAVCDAFPALKTIKPPKNSRLPFRLGKNRNAEYAEILGRLGILSLYSIDSGEFHYGYPVTKGEACDIIVRACIAALGE
ncbi:MAG: FAD-dependent oxidoreductase [Synergistaceae bacterium]|nr:FAD-dependent oxidoreductase [Synergistaceae bacterium]